MQARHTQGLTGIRAMPSKTLVNRTRMKVVNIALTKNFRHSGMRALARRPGIQRQALFLDSGFARFARAPE
jgi:hypothetical protein